MRFQFIFVSISETLVPLILSFFCPTLKTEARHEKSLALANMINHPLVLALLIDFLHNSLGYVSIINRRNFSLFMIMQLDLDVLKQTREIFMKTALT